MKVKIRQYGKPVEVEVDVVPLAEGFKVVNATLTDMVFDDGLVIPGCDHLFNRLFKATVHERAVVDTGNYQVFTRDICAGVVNMQVLDEVLKQFPADVFILASAKTMIAFKHPRVICPDRNQDRTLTGTFERCVDCYDY